MLVLLIAVIKIVHFGSNFIKLKAEKFTHTYGKVRENVHGNVPHF